MDLHELDVRINAAGQLPSQINDAVVALINSGKVSVLELGPLLTPLGKLSAALQGIQGWSNAAKAGDKVHTDAGLPPGFVVADVGDVGDPNGQGLMPIEYLTLPNIAYFQQNALGPFWAKMFSGTLAQLNAKIGVRPGDVANAVPDSVVRDPAGTVVGDMATWG